MSQENVERLRHGLEAFNRRDRAAWLVLCDPELENVPPRLRWVARFCLECEDVTLEQVERAAGALRELLWNADEATRALGELCARNGIRQPQADAG